MVRPATLNSLSLLPLLAGTQSTCRVNLSQFRIETAVDLPPAQQVLVVSHCWPFTDIAVHLILVCVCLSEYIFPLVEARCLLCSGAGAAADIDAAPVSWLA